MRTFECQCGNTLFFENTICVACGNEVGWCPGCRRISALLPQENGNYKCANSECGVLLTKCHNYAVENVCNRCIIVDDETPREFCDYCRFNDTIPDLSVEGYREKWYRLEQAKRRLLYSLDLLKLPYGSEEDGFDPPLSFDFKADTGADVERNWSTKEGERIFTGYAAGKITINIREADPVEREKARVAFAEPHRTLIRHFRHEMGHFYWQVLVANGPVDEFRTLFGDHEQPAYADAIQRYYAEGPPADWQQNFVTAYATMHPWEDFAESFASYLEMASLLDTALTFGFRESCEPTTASLDDMLVAHQKMGIKLNELSRNMGLVDMIPTILPPPAVEKLRFIHRLVTETRAAAVGDE